MSDHCRTSIKRLLNRTVTEQDARDRQKAVGPSELGSPCDYCLGIALTRKYPEFRPEGHEPRSRFGLKAWNGTAVHEKLERSLSRRLEREELEGVTYLLEQTVTVYHLDGYGDIPGHVDMVVGYPEYNYLCVVDHKGTDRDKLRTYLAEGVPTPYVFQVNLYARGVEALLGKDVQDVAIHFLPRDSNSADDIRVVFAARDPRVDQRALDRLEMVWEEVREGRLERLHRSQCWDCTWTINV